MSSSVLPHYFSTMLPSLSAGILHQTLEFILASDSLFAFELPPRMLITLAKIVEKILVICQADLRVTVPCLATLVTVQTVLHNPTYRQRVEKSYSEGEEVQLSAKESLAILLQHTPTDVLDEMASTFSTLWETLKTKHIFLLGVSEIRPVLSYLNSRLLELYTDLQAQVLTSAFSDLDQRVLPLGIQELKFERIEAKETHLITSKDLVRSKLEYLKNFRDLFGEFEYHLELVDCLSANITEKTSIIREAKEGRQQSESSLDAVSKKLVGNFVSSGLQLSNHLDASFWELTRETAQCVTSFLLVFFRDSVFVDYFQSSWAILSNFLAVLEDKREEKINSVLHTIFKTVDDEFLYRGSLTSLHVLKCLHYVMEHTSKTQPLAYDHTTTTWLVRLLHILAMQLRHTQNSDLVRLLRLLLAKFPEEVTPTFAQTMFLIFADKGFDLEAENGTKIVEVILEICSKRQDRDEITMALVHVAIGTGSSVSAAKK